MRNGVGPQCAADIALALGEAPGGNPRLQVLNLSENNLGSWRMKQRQIDADVCRRGIFSTLAVWCCLKQWVDALGIHWYCIPPVIPRRPDWQYAYTQHGRIAAYTADRVLPVYRYTVYG